MRVLCTSQSSNLLILAYSPDSIKLWPNSCIPRKSCLNFGAYDPVQPEFPYIRKSELLNTVYNLDTVIEFQVAIPFHEETLIPLDGDVKCKSSDHQTHT